MERRPPAVSTVMRLSGISRPGPIPTFTTAHAFLALLTLGEAEPIGRQVLAESVGLGPGAVRTLLKKLREEGLAETESSGCRLTKPGRRVLEAIERNLTPPLQIGESNLTIGRQQVALAVRGARGKVRRGIEQRDAAIRVGASGATTYLIQRGLFTMPDGSPNCEVDFPSEAWQVLRRGLKPKNDDAIILCGAADKLVAKLGSLAAAVTLL